MDAREVLLKAAEIIGRDGHHKNSLFAAEQGGPQKAPVCAMGAINRAVCGSALLSPMMPTVDWNARCGAVDLLQAYIGDSLNIPDWNDDDDNCAEEVILTMKNAAH